MKNKKPENKTVGQKIEHVIRQSLTLAALLLTVVIATTAYMTSPFLPNAYGELEQTHMTYAQADEMTTNLSFSASTR